MDIKAGDLAEADKHKTPQQAGRSPARLTKRLGNSIGTVSNRVFRYSPICFSVYKMQFSKGWYGNEKNQS